MRDGPRFRFSMRLLFIATTVAAVVAALVSRIRAPGALRAVIGAYLILLAVYLTFNLFRTIRVIAQGRKMLQQIRHCRQVACTRHDADEMKDKR